MPKFDVTIEEKIHYFTTVEAESAEAAQEQVELAMQQLDWEDPERSDVQGQQVVMVEEVMG